MSAPLRRNAGLAFFALLTSSGTLICCVLPALMVGLGAGATLAALVSAVPQLVWLSENKMLVFGTAAAALAFAGVAMWRARRAPCPVDPTLARACIRLRKISAGLYLTALLVFGTGITFAIILPWLAR